MSFYISDAEITAKDSGNKIFGADINISEPGVEQDDLSNQEKSDCTMITSCRRIPVIYHQMIWIIRSGANELWIITKHYYVRRHGGKSVPCI